MSGLCPVDPRTGKEGFCPTTVSSTWPKSEPYLLVPGGMDSQWEPPPMTVGHWIALFFIVILLIGAACKPTDPPTRRRR